MIVKRGDIWLAELDLSRGSEQAGIRPVIVFQNELINVFTTTILAIPLTTNLRRASLPSCLQIFKGEDEIASDSVALCHQLRVLDKTRLQRKLGSLTPKTITALETCVLFTLGIITDI